jgi:hypothetical protein
MPYKNKEDQVACSKKFYEANKEKIKADVKKRNAAQNIKNRAYIKEIKIASGCVDCGESNHVVLDFDHVKGDKLKNVSGMVHQSYSIKTIQKEIDKCEIRCSNCHRIVTHNRRIEKKLNAKTNS